MKKLVGLGVLLLLVVTLQACKENENVIKVGATAVPHAEILEQIRPLLKEQGYELKIIIFDDYVLPNVALVNNDLHANYFQHVPYLTYYNSQYQTSIENAGGVHIEPIGIYSKRYSSLTELKDGDTVLMSHSVSDQGRMLSLLASKGLLTLKSGVNPFNATLADIDQNPKNLNFLANVAPEMLNVAYANDEAALILINTNFALLGGLRPGLDALALEDASLDNPYVNLVAVNAGKSDDPKIVALVNALQSSTIQAWILAQYEGDVVPVSLP